MERINEKIQDIEKFLEELEALIPNSLEEYKTDFKSKAACERYCEKIMEAAIDLIFLIIKERKLQKPRDDKNAIEILFKNNIISKDISRKLQDAKGMRNILAHEYGEVNDKIVFDALKDELINDINQFIKEVSK